MTKLYISLLKSLYLILMLSTLYLISKLHPKWRHHPAFWMGWQMRKTHSYSIILCKLSGGCCLFVTKLNVCFSYRSSYWTNLIHAVSLFLTILIIGRQPKTKLVWQQKQPSVLYIKLQGNFKWIKQTNESWPSWDLLGRTQY